MSINIIGFSPDFKLFLSSHPKALPPLQMAIRLPAFFFREETA